MRTVWSGETAQYHGGGSRDSSWLSKPRLPVWTFFFFCSRRSHCPFLFRFGRDLSFSYTAASDSASSALSFLVSSGWSRFSHPPDPSLLIFRRVHSHSSCKPQSHLVHRLFMVYTEGSCTAALRGEATDGITVGYLPCILPMQLKGKCAGPMTFGIIGKYCAPYVMPFAMSGSGQ